MNVPGASYQYVVMHNAETSTADGAEIPLAFGGSGAYSVAAIQLTGINGETITFEGTIDGTNWVSVPFTGVTSGTSATTATADGIFRATVMGLVSLRARISTGGSGAVTAIGVATA